MTLTEMAAQTQTTIVETPSPTPGGYQTLLLGTPDNAFSFYPNVVDYAGTLDPGSTLYAISPDDTDFTLVSAGPVTTAVNGQYLTFSANTDSDYTLAPIAGETQSDIDAINAALAIGTAISDTFYYQLTNGTVIEGIAQLEDTEILTNGSVPLAVSTIEVGQHTATLIPGLTVAAAASSGQSSDAQQFMTLTVALVDYNTGQNDGTLSLDTADEGPGHGGTITTDGNGSITIAGSIAQINADLQGLVYNSPTASAGDDVVYASIHGGVGEQTFEIITACYASGTHIATRSGPVAIERLRIGDRVCTLSGQTRPIIWIGQRSYDPRFAAANRDVWPIQIRAGALGDAMPARDLYVSPRHAMFLDGVLIPAAELVNGVTILRSTPAARVDYFHIELDAHDIILAEGAASESYIDHDNRQMFHNAALYPQSDRAEMQDCAPRVEHGAIIEAVRARLLARAQGAAPLVQQILLGGADVIQTTIAAGVTEVHLVSDSGQVAGDHRTLGALVLDIRLDGASLSLQDPRLMRGFHAAERHGGAGVRWTNGQGILALPHAQSARNLEIVVGAVMAGKACSPAVSAFT